MNEPVWSRHAPELPFIDKAMQSQVGRWNADKVKWELRPPTFVSSMVIQSWRSTMSGATFTLLAEDGYTYITTLDSIAKIMASESIVHDQIPRLTWQFYKQGQSYLTKVVLDD